MHKKTLIVIAGPTASGKSSLALQLAQELEAQIFSADSRQIYKELHIGTAKPSPEELNLIKHHFIDHISIHEQYSGGRYADECKLALAAYFQTRETAILVGGTGLYIHLLLNGMDIMPEVPVEVLAHFEQMLEKEGVEALQRALFSVDPDYAQFVDMQNTRRIIRALAVCEASGRPYSSFRNNTANALPYRILPFLIDIPRETLYARIDERVDQMMRHGLKEEALALAEFRGLPALDTVGYREWFDHAAGKLNEDSAISLIKQNTRRYAKRQLTWFRKYGEWQPISGMQRMEAIQTIRTAYKGNEGIIC